MTWVRLDDSFSDHPKILKVGALGLALQVRAICYATRHLTDGKIMAAAIPLLVQPMACYMADPDDPMDDGMMTAMRDLPKEMVDAGLWHVTPGGWLIHDYLIYNPSKQEVLRLRAEKAKAGKAGAKARWGDGNGVAPAMPLPMPPSPTPPIPSETTKPTTRTISVSAFKSLEEISEAVTSGKISHDEGNAAVLQLGKRQRGEGGRR